MRYALFVAAITATLWASAQNVLYRNSEEFTAKQGETVDGPIDVERHWGRFMVVLEKEGQKERITTRKVWGFLNDGFLYRIEQKGHLPVRLMAQGAIMYWENSLAHLHIQHSPHRGSTF